MVEGGGWNKREFGPRKHIHSIPARGKGSEGREERSRKVTRHYQARRGAKWRERQIKKEEIGGGRWNFFLFFLLFFFFFFSLSRPIDSTTTFDFSRSIMRHSKFQTFHSNSVSSTGEGWWILFEIRIFRISMEKRVQRSILPVISMRTWKLVGACRSSRQAIFQRIRRIRCIPMASRPDE